MYTVVLETERLRLRHFSVDDAEFMLRLLNEPSFVQHIGDGGVRTLEDCRLYLLNGPLASYERFGFGMYRVELKESGVPIGMCGLLQRDSLDDVDVGYAFLPEFWSRGYAAEAAAAVIADAGWTFGLRRVVAVTNPDNDRSIRLLEKLGFRYERMVSLSAEKPDVKLFTYDF